ncbi:hypothetical protein TWF679_007032 [Orbilia oligospora]|uniref:ubiquitinyl hydrolase 1 n=1 Tax=Orbilia oligospora TaxID=2813651 RepID=A0A8H8VL19_ORBOL|nr:hypothetical protein TWF679_007032 [Orbilia oligospora]
MYPERLQYSGTSKSQLDYIIQHVVLPPKLPQEEVRDSRQQNFALLNFLQQVAERYALDISDQGGGLGECGKRQARKLLCLMASLHEPNSDFPQRLQEAILALNTDDAFAFHVVMQNAGIIFRRVDDTLQFEVFEASPLPEAVVKCKGRLKCIYPGPATTISWEVAKNPRFLKELGAFLSHLDIHEFTAETVSKSQKGGNSLSETRSTINPRYIIELLTGMMRGIGSEIQVKRVIKNIRDEVNWKAAKNPWRRSSVWLIARVALQTTLSENQYKCFLLEVVRVILEQAVQYGIDSYSISCISKKLAYRSQKVGEPNIPDDLLQRIFRTIEAGARLLSYRWEATIAKSERCVRWDPHLGTNQSITLNTRLRLEKASAWIEERMEAYQQRKPLDPTVRDPIERSRHLGPHYIPEISNISLEPEAAINLIDFENWIKKHLENWCCTTPNTIVVETLAKFIEEYHTKASDYYGKDSVLDKSTMLLTIMEIWVQLDRAVCDLEPLLSEYSPEIPCSILEPLLLVQREDMERLIKVERYLLERHSPTFGLKKPSIFKPMANSNGFSFIYYDKSTALQRMRSEITAKARAERSKKRQELLDLNKRHKELMTEYQEIKCQYHYSKKGNWCHAHYCRRCEIFRQANNMHITSHEWPLPEIEEEVRSVLFELQPPKEFLAWRNSTYYIMLDVCSTTPGTSKYEEHWDFESWPALAPYKTKDYARLTFASKAKPISRSHYSTIKIPALETDALVNHAGVYRLFDERNAEWVESRHKSCTAQPLCKSELSDSSYQNLTYAVNFVTHTHNEVIANQHQCPESITFREYEAFGSLRSGRHLQWHNILIELRKADLSFKNDCVYTLILHAACHAGIAMDPDDWKRDSHITLADETFSEELLKNLRSTLAVIKDNWEQANTLKTLCLLARRLASCGHQIVEQDTIKYLREIRKVCHPWVQRIQEKLETASEDSNVEYFRNWMLRISGIQCSTFDVDSRFLPAVFQTEEDVIEFLICSSSIYDNSLGVFSNLPSDLRLLLERNRRFAVLAEPYIHGLLQGNTKILSGAVGKILPTQPLSGSWERLSSPADRWWKLQTLGSEKDRITIIHVNILQGVILVDGRPNGRLPEDYFGHRHFQKLLGKRIFDVIPSKLPGMSYQTKKAFCGVVLHFHLEGGNLIIRKQDEETHEFVPSENFRADIPKPIYLAGSQWLNFDKSEVVFHQDDDWWKKNLSLQDWTLVKDSGFWMMKRQNTNLLDINGNAHLAAFEALQTLESRDYLVGTVEDNTTIDIDLPRYKLQFYINPSSEIECRTLRGWVIDESQKIGTFIGLQNFLKMKSGHDNSASESVLIPFGSIMPSFSKGSDHQTIQIDPGDAERKYTIFHIDRVLNRLKDDGSLPARYTRLHLHALSSGILPDPFTGRSGTEEALDGLRNAASFSFQKLQDNEAHILNTIARLTPARYFYPAHLEVMQKTEWAGSLPTWVQNDAFYPAVSDILRDWSRRQFLINDSHDHAIADLGSDNLLERARYRNSVLEPGDPFSSNRNTATRGHTLRHEISNSEAYVQDLARASFNWHPSQGLETDLQTLFSSISTLNGNVKGLSLSYSQEWSDSDPVAEWCTLYELCRQSERSDRFALLFTFSAFVYKDSDSRKLLKSLLAIATSGDFINLVIPNYGFFEPAIGDSPRRSLLRDFLSESGISFSESIYKDWRRLATEEEDDYYLRRHNAFKSALNSQIDSALEDIMRQWPSQLPNLQKGQNYSLLRVNDAIDQIIPIFEICFRNRELFMHLNKVAEKLRRLNADIDMLQIFDSSTLAPRSSLPDQEEVEETQLAFCLQDLLMERLPPTDLSTRMMLPCSLTQTINTFEQQVGPESVRSTIKHLHESREKFTQQYGKDLLRSVEALAGSTSLQNQVDVIVDSENLINYRDATKLNTDDLLSRLRLALSPSRCLEKLLQMAGLWPTVCKLGLLQKLRLKDRQQLHSSWRKAITELGESITWQQRANRLLQFSRDGAVQEFQREFGNTGQQNWRSDKYIDWLLLEIDSDILIRPVQADIGFIMMDEARDNNVVLQLNMGEGKSSVIVPAVAAALGDTQKLVRVLVLKPLATQMFNLLVQRLSGICHRRIYFLPFSRELSLSPSDVDKIRFLYEDCMAQGSILLTLPEHLLSLKLMGLEKLMQGDTISSLSKSLLDTQEWLEKNTRDILDESDEVLHIRYQLVYTLGPQRTLEGGRDRWEIVQEVLDLLQEKAIEWAVRDPVAVEVVAAETPKFPSVRIIDESKGVSLLREMAEDICLNNNNKIQSISSKLQLLSKRMRELAFRYISIRDIGREEEHMLLQACGHLQTQLLILRGLIAHGVLLFTLRDKRYRVDYGLDPDRPSRTAVPYRAKDQPAVKAEFGHPEVVLILTCLTYYYGGLKDSDLQNCFDLLLRTDDPDLTYEHWTKRYSSVPTSLSKLRGLNLLDQDQMTKEIFPFFRFNKDVIDFFLSEIVFPREAKEFPQKLSTSGWDLAERKLHNTTGFSGTNDNRHLLPTSIKQLDLPQQTHTNSLVLMNILREENDIVIKAQGYNSKLNAAGILGLIVEQDPKIQVLLDVGAQILELNNKEVARTWLDLDKSTKILGAVFFGPSDELLVMGRDKRLESFSSSALSQQLDRVLVYLDEAHTRGTDLKLPIGSRAAVTLGPNLVKDKFVQGCMRMRKLGKGHSLAFIASPDIYTQIQLRAGKAQAEKVSVSDVLLWTMLETCRQTQHGFSIWADQGFKYLRRKSEWDNFRLTGNQSELKVKIVEVESRPLLEMYGVSGPREQIMQNFESCDDSRVICDRLDRFATATSHTIGVQEEQEREVDHEVQEETHIERPEPAKPKQHSLHPDVVSLVEKGYFNINSAAFERAFNIFSNTSSRRHLEANAWPSNLLVTKDFAETVDRNADEDMDNYLRPVRWLFSLAGRPEIILVSPWEANTLIKTFRESSVSRLHCYAPRVSRNMQTFERLDVSIVSNIPKQPNEEYISSRTRLSLNIFAGQLYFESMGDYQEVCEFLGIYYNQLHDSIEKGSDGWVSRATWEVLCQSALSIAASRGSYSHSPIPFLVAMIGMRRKGQSFASTHLGCLLDARVLQAKDFE